MYLLVKLKQHKNANRKILIVLSTISFNSITRMHKLMKMSTIKY